MKKPLAAKPTPRVQQGPGMQSQSESFRVCGGKDFLNYLPIGTSGKPFWRMPLFCSVIFFIYSLVYFGF